MNTRYSMLDGYQIRVKDHLDPCWAEYFEDWEFTRLENGEFLLSRARVDQPALQGALNRILDLNLTLVAVTRIPAGQEPQEEVPTNDVFQKEKK